MNHLIHPDSLRGHEVYAISFIQRLNKDQALEVHKKIQEKLNAKVNKIIQEIIDKK